MNNTLSFFIFSIFILSNPPIQSSSINLLSFILAIVTGVIISALINYLADVLPLTRNLSRPICPECNQPHSIKEYLVSYKCTNCGHKRSIRSIIVLIGTILCSVLLKLIPFSILGFWETLPILIFLGVILVIDIEHHLVLIETSLFGILLFSIYGVIMRGFTQTLLGGLGGLLIMLAFYLLGIVFSKIVGKLRGQEISEVVFGFGDVCAGTFLGLLAGWPTIIGAIIIAILTFSAFSIVFLLTLILTKRYRAFASAQPFVPFLILGTIVMFYL